MSDITRGNMSRLAFILFAVVAIAAAEVPSRSTPAWSVLGDTTGAPSGCSAAAAIAGIDSFVTAFQRADSAALARAMARRYRDGFAYSTGRFTPTDPFVSAFSIPALLRYSRHRVRQHERLVVQQVTFNGWRDRGLEFGPILFSRSADDLGPAPLMGIGKGEYWCGQGLSSLNTGPAPTYRPRAK